MRNKARVAGVVVAAAAGIMALGAPAFASEHNDVDVNHNHEYNGVNVLNENNVQVPIGLCNNNVAGLGLVIPILSPQTAGDCSTAVIDN